MAVGIAAGMHNGGMPRFGYRQEVMRMTCRANRVDGDFQIAVRTVFETDRTRQAAGEFAVYLTFRRPRTDRAPRNQVRVILRRNHVEELRRSGHAHIVQRQQQAARLTQAVVDVERTVQVRVVNQTFPTHRRARFFKIHAHHNQQFFFIFLAQHQQTFGVFQGGFGVVDGTRTDNHQQAVVLAVNQIGDFMPRAVYQPRRFIRNRQLVQMGNRRQQLFDFSNLNIVGRVLFGHCYCFQIQINRSIDYLLYLF